MKRGSKKQSKTTGTCQTDQYMSDRNSKQTECVKKGNKRLEQRASRAGMEQKRVGHNCIIMTLLILNLPTFGSDFVKHVRSFNLLLQICRSSLKRGKCFTKSAPE